MLEELYNAAEKKIEPENDHRKELIEDVRKIITEQFLKTNTSIVLDKWGYVSTNPKNEITEMWQGIRKKYDMRTIHLAGLKELRINKKDSYNCSAMYDVNFLYDSNSCSMFSNLVKEINDKLVEERKVAKQFAERLVDEIIPKEYENAYFSENGDSIILEISLTLPEVEKRVLVSEIFACLSKEKAFESVKIKNDKVILEFNF